jgi:uncharacterized membrane protein YagU involved in acid resistance
MPSPNETSASDLYKGIVAGTLAGLAASFVMTRFHVALSGRGITGAEEPQSKKPVEGQDDAAMKSADVVAQTTTGRALTRHEKTEIGGPAAHYAFGAAAGAVYGAIREMNPDSPLAHGGRFGTAVWVVADQLGLPLAGLSPWPLHAYPATTNLQHLTSHLVYGWTTALTYSVLRRGF